MLKSKRIVLASMVSLFVFTSLTEACFTRKKGSRDVFKPYRIHRNYVGASIVDDMDPDDWEIGICTTHETL